jgi:hypothetical protein
VLRSPQAAHQEAAVEEEDGRERHLRHHQQPAGGERPHRRAAAGRIALQGIEEIAPRHPQHRAEAAEQRTGQGEADRERD